MHILPINNSRALQLNPNLGIILASDMEGWFLERFINIFMNGTTLDYVDNVNYAGVIGGQRCYSYEEVQEYGIINIIESEINRDNFIHIWVDEISIPNSMRYQKEHFVHPLMIYGYDLEQHICKTVFFDIRKGQVLIDIDYQDLIKATALVNQFYHYGGTDEAINKTISSYKLSNCVKGCFHLDVFLRQLSNYLCCKSEHCTEWYTLSRPGVFDSDANIFGIQIYMQIIEYLQSPQLRGYIKYKTLHDFVIHKKLLLDRFRYVQKNYDTSNEYNKLIDSFAENCKSLERIRLLNMKKQMQQGLFPAALCYESEYIAKLVDTLNECYNTEIRILPQIYNHLIKLVYPKNYYEQNKIISLSIKDGEVHDDFVEFDVAKYEVYLSRIDIVRSGKCLDSEKHEYILINNERKYFLEKDSHDHIPLRTISFHAIKLSTLCIYTNIPQYDYTINLYPMFTQTNMEAISINLDDSWTGYHHARRITSSDNDEFQLLLIDEDPFMVREKLGIDADKYSYLHIRMSTTANTIYAQIYFTTVDNPNISMDKSLFFKINPDGKTHSYYIKMAHNYMWHGVVQMIRFDPAQYHDDYTWERGMTSMCKIEKIEFLRNKPDDIIECMVASELQDDGSTFRS